METTGQTPEVVVREMSPEDVEQVIAIERVAYSFPWSEGIFRDCLRVGYICRVVELNSVIVGYCVMSTGAGEAHVLNLCVREEFRCRGIGGKLLEHLMNAAREAAVSEAFLEVRPSNTPAIRLYQSQGFVQIGMRRGYYQAAGGREDAVVLRRQLERSRSRD
ncbi:MAG: ribosomal protein S18-alanine N-acetyltransferase [Steroidobacteraceae bacterium]